MTQIDELLFTVEGGIARLTLNRPQARNAITSRMAQEYEQALLAADADPEVRVVVVRSDERDDLTLPTDVTVWFTRA